MIGIVTFVLRRHNSSSCLIENVPRCGAYKDNQILNSMHCLIIICEEALVQLLKKTQTFTIQ